MAGVKNLASVFAKFEQIATELSSERDVKVGDYLFTLRSLDAASDTDAHEASNPYSKIAYLYALKLETLARSIIKVDDVEIPLVVETEEMFKGRPLKKERRLYLKEVLGKFPQEVIDLLWREYGLLAEEVAQNVDENHVNRTGSLPRATKKTLVGLQESDVRELVQREVEEKKMADAEAENLNADETTSEKDS